MKKFFKEYKRVIIAFAVLIVVSFSLTFGLEKIDKIQRTKMINEMVEEGKLTPEQGDAILWLWYDYETMTKNRNNNNK